MGCVDIEKNIESLLGCLTGSDLSGHLVTLTLAESIIIINIKYNLRFSLKIPCRFLSVFEVKQKPSSLCFLNH